MITSFHLYCVSCTEAAQREARKHIWSASFAPTVPPSGRVLTDNPVFASSEWDSPQHCANGAECLEAEELSDGTLVGALLETELTSDGIEYVKAALRQRPVSPCARLWSERLHIPIQFTDEEFKTKLFEIVDDERTPSNLLTEVPGVYELVAEHFNNDVLDALNEDFACQG